ncbi:DUF4350 domain-containing protein [Methanoplanus endosymbiosus]|uniref:DUF4350 domain-containing protein n=1 Tax=Methanoplanus endosymbiosus TaxID=33865 RepID=A0A9E7PNG3_9EURY|nr:DUF4350 domain-containing protein [Methanoplanus endosymbiosus]UUX92184.1 DUF4350 domain-containing protein [Methanoplanus endosymbiosus]
MKAWHIVFFGLLIVALLIVDIHFSGNDNDFSRYNYNWNGTSQFYDDAGSEIITDYSSLYGRKNSTLLMIEPDGRFTSSEITALMRFIRDGNKIFISDEPGNSNTLLGILGTGISVTPANLSSVDMEYNNKRFIICYPYKEDRVTAGVESVALNSPSVAYGGVSLMRSSFLSWIDTNGNGKAEASEPLGKRSVMVRDEAGQVYLLSDSSLFINRMYGYKRLRDNDRFIQNIMGLSDNLLVEYRHSAAASADGLSGILSGLKNTDFIKISVIIIVALLTIFALVRREK